MQESPASAGPDTTTSSTSQASLSGSVYSRFHYGILRISMSKAVIIKSNVAS